MDKAETLLLVAVALSLLGFNGIALVLVIVAVAMLFWNFIKTRRQDNTDD